MLFYLLLLSFVSNIFCYEPSCYSCKYFIPHINGNQELGLCKMYKNNNVHLDNFITNRGANDITPRCKPPLITK